MSEDWSDLHTPGKAMLDENMAARRRGDRLQRLGLSLLALFFCLRVLIRISSKTAIPELAGEEMSPFFLVFAVVTWVIGGIGGWLTAIGRSIRAHAKASACRDE